MAGPAHVDLQKRVPAWLRARVTGRGLRYAPETHLGRGYVVDVVALASFQWRYHKAYGLGEKAGEQLLVFECKASRADYLSTFGPNAKGDHKNRLKPIGSMHWIVTYADVCPEWQVPHPWGLLVRSGSGLREEKKPDICPVEEGQRLKVAYELLWHSPQLQAPPEAYTADEWLAIVIAAVEQSRSGNGKDGMEEPKSS